MASLPRLTAYQKPLLLGVILFSLFFAWGHGGPLSGSLPALVVAAILQILLPGWLLVRCLRVETSALLLVRLAWVLSAGMGLAFTLGRLIFFLHPRPPAAFYVLALHALMALMVLFCRPAPREKQEESSRFWLYTAQLCAALCCAASLVFALWRGGLRFGGWEDQTFFIAPIQWIAYDVSSLPLRLQMRLEGFTLSYAGLAWASGTPAARLVWYDTALLFGWVPPLAVFSLAWALSGRARHAAYSAVVFTLAGLGTLDFLIVGTGTAFGANRISQFGTARLFSSAVLLPLAWFVLAAYLHRPRAARLVLLALAALMVAFTHQRQFAIFMLTGAVFMVLVGLARPNFRRRFRRRHILLLLGPALLALSIAWPYLTVVLNASSHPRAGDPSETLFLLGEFPLLGEVFILPPPALTGQPLLIAAAAASFLMVLWPRFRRRLEVLFGLSGTLATLAVMFGPGITMLFIRLFGLRQAIYFVLALPVGLILGTALEASVEWLNRPVLHRVALALLVAAVLLTALEPFPLPWSARDQARTMNQLQSLHNIRPADEALLAELAAFDFQEPTTILAPYRIGGFVLESIHDVFVPNWRYEITAEGYEGASRFYQDPSDLFLKAEYPFLDAQDLVYLKEQHIDYIVISTTGTRIPQLLLDARFERVLSVEGYEVFRVQGVRVNLRDWLFAAMNRLYDAQAPPTRRWKPEDFQLFRVGAPRWAWLAEVWAWFPDADVVAQYGLAFSRMMAGDDANALPLWEQLYALQPESSLLMAALAHTQLWLDEEAALPTLETALQSALPAMRTAAADLCLSEPVLHVLDDAQASAAVEAVNAFPDTWNLLYQENAKTWRNDTARRAALAVSRGYYEDADAWLEALPAALTYPSDHMLRAGLRLARQDTEGALGLLAPVRDPDQMAAARAFHPDIWQQNPAPALYAMLRANRAARAGDFPAAVSLYREAIDAGFTVAGHVFLARMYHAAGDMAAAEGVLAEMEALDTTGAALWAATERLALGMGADTFSALNAELEALRLPLLYRPEDAPRLVSWLDMPPARVVQLKSFRIEADEVAVRGLFAAGNTLWYAPVRWEAHVFDASTFVLYGAMEVPAMDVPGALTAWTLYVPVEDAAAFTPARLSLAAAHNWRVRYPIEHEVAVTLNPEEARAGEIAQPVDYTFGEALHLEGYSLELTQEVLALDLYWRALVPVPRDLSIFISVLDTESAVIEHIDAPPLEGRYPVSQWKPGLLLRDERRIHFEPPLDAEASYRVVFGVRPLNSLDRLEITPQDDRVANRTLTLGPFTLP